MTQDDRDIITEAEHSKILWLITEFFTKKPMQQGLLHVIAPGEQAKQGTIYQLSSD